MHPVFAVLFAVLLSAAQREGSSGSRPRYAMHPEYNAIIVCDEPVIDIGTIWAGPDIQARFPIRNEGTEAAWIRVSYSAGGTHAPCITVIEPGETIFVSVKVLSSKVHQKFARKVTVQVIDEPRLAIPACFGAPSYTDWCIRYSAGD